MLKTNKILFIIGNIFLFAYHIPLPPINHIKSKYLRELWTQLGQIWDWCIYKNMEDVQYFSGLERKHKIVILQFCMKYSPCIPSSMNGEMDLRDHRSIEYLPCHFKAVPLVLRWVDCNYNSLPPCLIIASTLMWRDIDIDNVVNGGRHYWKAPNQKHWIVFFILYVTFNTPDMSWLFLEATPPIETHAIL